MCGGPFNLVCHWGPLIAIAIVKCVALTSLHCVTMWWPPTESIYALINGLIFASWNALLLYHFFSAMFVGPGFVPLGWRPDDPEDEMYLQFCQTCQGFKAPRAHHCRKCDRCVLKMDHHCPWINNCLGHRNHGNFTLFLLFAVIGCFHASWVLSSSVYRAVYRSWHIAHNLGPYVYLGMNGCLMALFSLGLAIGVILAVGLLFIVQMKGILKNETGIESWIVAKAKRPNPDEKPFIYPYNLGWKENLKAVFCRTESYDDDDGVVWPIVNGCDQYTLTVEQLRQKEEKKMRMREYTIIENYSGSWFPITKGFRVFFSPPCSDESRIAIKTGDRVQVSRWKKHWLYGERVCDSENKPLDVEARGWFPRKCAVDIIDGNSKSHLKIINKKKKKTK